MRKLMILLFLGTLLLPMRADSTSYLISKKGQIRLASVIAIVDVKQVEGDPSSVEKVTASVNQIIKGETGKEIIMECVEIQCTAGTCSLDVGQQYLVFLVPKASNYTLRQAYGIKDDKVNWFIDRGPSPMEYQPLDKVLNEIKEEIKSPTWKESDDPLINGI